MQDQPGQSETVDEIDSDHVRKLPGVVASQVFQSV
jgi:hypothetical protein